MSPKHLTSVFVAVFILAVTASVSVHAQQLTFYKIGSGGKGGVYYPVAGLIAKAISNPPGSKSCEQGGNCGVPGLTATALSTGGSVANVSGLTSDEYHAGIAQSDVAYWAFSGTGPYRNRGPNKKICAVAGLYPETMHLVGAKGAGIGGVPDLAGKRVAMGKADSGALLGAQLMVRAYGMEEGKHFTPSLVDFQGARKLMTEGKVDAFVFVTGYPSEAIRSMSEKLGARLVPIVGAGRDKLVKASPFYTAASIPAGTYPGQPETIETVAVSALWISRTNLADDLVYAVTRAFWSNKHARSILDQGHPKARNVTMDTVFDGVAIPLCAGAARYYKEIGKIK